MEKIIEFFNYKIPLGEKASITVKALLFSFLFFIAASFFFKITRNLITKKMSKIDKAKFFSVFYYLKWLVYVVIFLITLQTSGINVTAIFAASAALLIGIGLALQTLFQDIISGIFILIDQTVLAGDIIELEGKVGKIKEINLRTTKAITIDNKVMIIPNHLYLTNTLYNWTANDILTRETIKVGVAYGSDVQLVKSLLEKAANSHHEVLKTLETFVLFADFGESSLNFEVVFTLKDSFRVKIIQSEIRFDIDRLFREHQVIIPFPQRDIHVIKK